MRESLRGAGLAAVRRLRRTGEQVGDALGSAADRLKESDAGERLNAAFEIRRVIKRAEAAHARGNPAMAHRLLEQELRARPGDEKLAIAFWRTCVAMERAAEAAEGMLRVIRARAVEGHLEEAASLWCELVDVAPDALPDAGTLVRIVPALQEGASERAVQALRASVHPETRGLTPGLALRVVDLARELDPAAALRAARVALESPDLVHQKRAKLERQVAELERAVARAAQEAAAAAEAVSSEPERTAPTPRPPPPERAPAQDAGALLADEDLADLESDAFAAPLETGTAMGESGSLELGMEMDESGSLELGMEMDESGSLELGMEMGESGSLELGMETGESGSLELGMEPDGSESFELGTETEESGSLELGIETGGAEAFDAGSEVVGIAEPIEIPAEPEAIAVPVAEDPGEPFAELVVEESEPVAELVEETVDAFAPAARFVGVKMMEATPLGLDDTSVELVMTDGRRARLEHASIQAVAVAEVGGLAAEPVVVIDLALNWHAEGDEMLRVVRLRSDLFDAGPLEGADPQILRSFLARLLSQSEAVPLPDAQAALADPFCAYADLDTYHREVLQAG